VPVVGRERGACAGKVRVARVVVVAVRRGGPPCQVVFVSEGVGVAVRTCVGVAVGMTVRSSLGAGLSRDPKRDPRALAPVRVIGPVPRQVPEGSDEPPEDVAGELDERGLGARFHVKAHRTPPR
jgi:hypothetical protein